MAHFAELDAAGVVRRVLVVGNEDILENGQESEAKGIAFLQSLFGPGRWKQTSYSGSFRKNFAGVGFAYDAERDAFIAPCPMPSWRLNEDTCRWEPPVPYPADGRQYLWDEPTTSWIEAN